MQGQERRAALAAYKERTVTGGVYAVRCAPTGECWVGAAPDLSTIRNRLWFQLRTGGSPYRDLQAAWNRHGAEAFTLEVVERLDEEDLAFTLQATLRARAKHWGEVMKAPML